MVWFWIFVNPSTFIKGLITHITINIAFMKNLIVCNLITIFLSSHATNKSHSHPFQKGFHFTIMTTQNKTDQNNSTKHKQLMKYLQHIMVSFKLWQTFLKKESNKDKPHTSQFSQKYHCKEYKYKHLVKLKYIHFRTFSHKYIKTFSLFTKAKQYWLCSSIKFFLNKYQETLKV